MRESSFYLSLAHVDTVRTRARGKNDSGVACAELKASQYATVPELALHFLDAYGWTSSIVLLHLC